VLIKAVLLSNRYVKILALLTCGIAAPRPDNMTLFVLSTVPATAESLLALLTDR